MVGFRNFRIKKLKKSKINLNDICFLFIPFITLLFLMNSIFLIFKDLFVLVYKWKYLM